MQEVSDSPPRAPPIRYTAPLGTRWAKEKAAAGGAAAFDLPTDPKHIGPWILGECVGKGASGRVKIAKHRRTGQLAAVKILPIAPLVNSRASLATQQAKSEKQRLGIDREITMMKLMNHPNIMRIYDVYEGEKELFLVLEYVEGGELFDFLVNRGRLPPNEALQFFKQIIYGLNYAHTFSIIHRDLKPENILIASLDPPIIKIADWGMAAFAPPTLQLETSCGSPHYASPEIVNGEKYHGNATDIWSCGVILYALLTGRLPFDDKNVRTLLSKVKSGKYEMPAWIDPLAKDLLTKMLVVDVNKRINIPDILAHPWVCKPVLQPLKSPSEKNVLLVPPPLPPSPSILAKPITSANLIDPELFSSLRIIWGRHADAQGASIQRDLCSPAGQGVHAKAFYFLLDKYREQSTRNRSHEALVAGKPGPSDSDLDLETVKFNLGWELDQSRGIRKHDINIKPAFNPNSDRQLLPVKADISIKSPGKMSSASNRMVRGRTVTETSALPKAMAGSPDPRLSPSGKAPVEARYCQTHLTSPLGAGRPNTFHGNGRGGPRPVPPRRGHIGSVNTVQSPTRSWRQFDSGVTSLPPPSNQRPRHSTSPGFFNMRGDVEHRFMVPRTPCSSFVDSPISGATEQKNETPAIHDPVTVQTNLRMDVDLPRLMSPKTSDVQLQKAMDDIADRVNAIAPTGINSCLIQSIASPMNVTADMETCEHSEETEPEPIKSTPKVGSSETKTRVVPRLPPDNDKENQSIGDDDWTHVNMDDGQTPGVGLGMDVVREIGKEITNATNIVSTLSPPKSKKEKERKSRPPPLDLPSTHQARMKLGSPIHLSSPVVQGSVGSNRLMASPVVGEFRGWFSNLFNWKAHHLNGHGGIFYSFDDIGKTRDATIAVFQALGFIVSKGDGDYQSERAEIYHCRLDQFVTDPQTNLSLKPTRFKVEFILASPSIPAGPPDGNENLYFSSIPAPSPNYLSTPSSGVTFRPRSSLMMGRSSSSYTPSPSPLGSSHWELPPGCACAIALAYEKGSISAFRTVRQKLREMYGNSQGMNTSPCFSPTLPNSPYEDHHPRSAV